VARDDHRRLRPGYAYSWAELGRRFDFAPEYPGIAGGMISRPEHDALLLITHPAPRSFDYGDSWQGDDLIYTGRGKQGDQEYAAQNRDVGENARTLHVFEPAGPRVLAYLGQATCVDKWQEMALDLHGKSRMVWRFQLRFAADTMPIAARASALPYSPVAKRPRSVVLRPFDPAHVAATPAVPSRDASPEAIARLQEKAARGHQRILVTLHTELRNSGWSELSYMPTAVDLSARDPVGRRVLFEAKTIRSGTERARVRSGLAQLLEYRYVYGDENDGLCLVTNAALATERVAFLESLGIALVVCADDRVFVGSPMARRMLGAGAQ
jgi:hypothetical protein